jgi:penicillin-binding protein 1C
VLFVTYLVYFIFCLPSALFQTPFSKLLVDKDGYLLEARIAKDEQWRFPIINAVPVKFEKCITEYEDQHFRYHPGVNPIALVRAAYLNIKNGKIVSGASTITMQTIRLSRQNKNRSLLEKAIEMTWAVRLELTHSKDEILQLYVTQAPFGGNVVGVETASWRYFNRAPSELSWAENAMLAVLPNAPGLIHLSRNRTVLKTKRDRLLLQLWEGEELTKEEYDIAISEPLPDPVNSLPHHAFHLIDRFAESGKIQSTLDFQIQTQFTRAAQSYWNQLKQQDIHNLSAVLIEVSTGNVISYVGNIQQKNDEHAGKVDMLRSVRSSGSILKPFLYIGATDDGIITPQQLLPDYPMNFYGYRPANYNPDFDGLVPADEALYRSLNIPSAWLLSSFGITKFKSQLNRLGMSSVDRPAHEYGLSMILGGAEVNLLELSSAYASFAYQLQSHTKETTYATHLTFEKKSNSLTSQVIYDKGSIYSVFTALTNTYRPEKESHWKNFSSGRKIAWKTGTSFGNRDAWAVGITPEYVIGVWVGNSSGEGVSGMTGLNHAAPFLFRLTNLLPQTSWFDEPYSLQMEEVCVTSGMKSTKYCPKTKESFLPQASSKAKACPYHQPVLLNDNLQRVYKNCASSNTQIDTFFVLPPIVSHYYALKNPNYKDLPEWQKECINEDSRINILYPINGGKISIPKDSDGGITAKIFYDSQSKALFWDLNGEYIGTTSSLHEAVIYPNKEKNKLTVSDENGNVFTSSFTVN